MTIKLIEQLKEMYLNLSKSQQKVAKLFFDDMNIINYSTAAEIGKMANVSESTVIRLSQTLGYKGYTDFQDDFRQNFPQGRILAQSQEVRGFDKDSLLKDLIEGDIQNLELVMKTLEEANLEKIAQMITSANKVFIVGQMSTYGLAHFLSQWLHMMLGHTQLLTPNTVNYYSELGKLDEETVVISIVFPRYLNSTLEIIKIAKEKGAKVIAITDSELSPVAPYADFQLTIPINSKLEIDSYASVMSVLNALTRYVSIVDSERVQSNLKEIEKYYAKNKIFYMN
ncbi:MurR/RpiR family transcriptional regulator [Peribacillus butanolivorans]|uniref:MurR/RpiR family transcriptional regulator n=1 Tax=Peribacillus butanolivorans TaxID=421767 RepID=UPI0036635F78